MKLLNMHTELELPINAFRDKAFNVAKNSKYEGYQKGLASIVYKCFDKKSAKDSTNRGTRIVSDAVPDNQQLAKNVKSQLLEKSKNLKYIHLLNTKFKVVILHIRN